MISGFALQISLLIVSTVCALSMDTFRKQWRRRLWWIGFSCVWLSLAVPMVELLLGLGR